MRHRLRAHLQLLLLRAYCTVLVFRTMARQLRSEQRRGHDFLSLLPISVIERSKRLARAISKRPGLR